MTVTFGKSPNRYSDPSIDRGTFSANAMVLTPTGPKPFGDIEERDMIVSHDKGAVMVMERKRKPMSSGGGNAPIRIAEIGIPPFYVSPSTLFMANSRSCRKALGSEEVLVRAGSLRNASMGDVTGVEETDYVSLTLQHPAMIYVNGFVCECGAAATGDRLHLNATFASRRARPSTYPILSDEEASLLYEAAGGAANVLKFVRWGEF